MFITQSLCKTLGGKNSFRLVLKVIWNPMANCNCAFLILLMFGKNRPSRCSKWVAKLNVLIIWISYQVVLNFNFEDFKVSVVV